MALSSLKRGFQNRLYVDSSNESSYADTSTTADVDFGFNLTSGVQLRRSQAFLSDRDLANNVEFETLRYPTEKSLRPTTLPMWASPEAIGLFGSFALGDDTPAQLGGLAAYSHTIAMSALGFPGSFPAQTNMAGATKDADTDEKHVGVYVRRFAIIGGRTGVATMEVEVGGGGATVTAESPTESGINFPATYFLNNKCRVGIKAATAEGQSSFSAFGAATAAGTFATITAGNSWTLLGEQGMDWRLEFDNLFDEASMYSGGMSNGVGVYGVQPHHGQFRQASLTVTFKNDSVVQDYIHEAISATATDSNQWMVGVEMVSDLVITTGYYHQAVAILPLAVIADTPDVSGDLGVQTESITFQAQKTSVGTSRNPFLLYTQDGYSSAYNQ